MLQGNAYFSVYHNFSLIICRYLHLLTNIYEVIKSTQTQNILHKSQDTKVYFPWQNLLSSPIHWDQIMNYIDP